MLGLVVRGAMAPQSAYLISYNRLYSSSPVCTGCGGINWAILKERVLTLWECKFNVIGVRTLAGSLSNWSW